MLTDSSPSDQESKDRRSFRQPLKSSFNLTNTGGTCPFGSGFTLSTPSRTILIPPQCQLLFTQTEDEQVRCYPAGKIKH